MHPTAPTAAPAPEPIGLDANAIIQAYADELMDATARRIMAEQTVKQLTAQVQQLQQELATQRQSGDEGTVEPSATEE